MSEPLEEHVSFDQLRSIVGDALHATAYGSGHRAVWPARYAAHVDLLLRILAEKDATIAALERQVAEARALVDEDADASGLLHELDDARATTIADQVTLNRLRQRAEEAERQRDEAKEQRAMSKASEWASQGIAVAYELDGYWIAGVAVKHDRGVRTPLFKSVHRLSLEPHEAIDLARWILDTFGDAP